MCNYTLGVCISIHVMYVEAKGQCLELFFRHCLPLSFIYHYLFCSALFCFKTVWQYLSLAWNFKMSHFFRSYILSLRVLVCCFLFEVVPILATVWSDLTTLPSACLSLYGVQVRLIQLWSSDFLVPSSQSIPSGIIHMILKPHHQFRH